MSTKRKLCITIDVEALAPRAADRPLERLIWGESSQGPRGLSLIMDIADRHGVAMWGARFCAGGMTSRYICIQKILHGNSFWLAALRRNPVWGLQPTSGPTSSSAPVWMPSSTGTARSAAKRPGHCATSATA